MMPEGSPHENAEASQYPAINLANAVKCALFGRPVSAPYLTGDQFNPSIVVGHKPVLGDIPKFRALDRLSRRNGASSGCIDQLSVGRLEEGVEGSRRSRKIGRKEP
jgi:hypothetical protein